jgi:chorismate synthase
VFEGRTTGTPIAITIENRDQRSPDYDEIREKYRPGHADFTFDAKFGFRDYRGGGRSSARETAVRVAAGAVAKKLLRVQYGTAIVGYVKQIGDVVAEIPDPASVTLDEVESNIVRCPDAAAAARMIDLIERVRREGDSVGGIAEIVARGVRPGWGEPVFDKLKADLAKAMLSLPAVMGFEYGAGFAVSGMKGSEANDAIEMRDGRVSTRTNRHGGMLGGISSGMPIVLRCAVKPTSSIPREQDTVTRGGEPTTIAVRGRHDPCLLPRFVPMAEAMMALTLADHALRHEAGRP